MGRRGGVKPSLVASELLLLDALASARGALDVRARCGCVEPLARVDAAPPAADPPADPPMAPCPPDPSLRAADPALTPVALVHPAPASPEPPAKLEPGVVGSARTRVGGESDVREYNGAAGEYRLPEGGGEGDTSAIASLSRRTRGEQEAVRGDRAAGVGARRPRASACAAWVGGRLRAVATK